MMGEWKVGRVCRGRASVATAKADVFRKNAISMENKFTKIMKIFENIDEVKSRRVI